MEIQILDEKKKYIEMHALNITVVHISMFTSFNSEMLKTHLPMDMCLLTKDVGGSKYVMHQNTCFVCLLAYK